MAAGFVKFCLFAAAAGLMGLRVAAGDVDISVAGDSTVESFGKDDVSGWGEVIGEHFKGAIVSNHAKGGLSTKTFISEGLWNELLSEKPDFILLQFGHNDSHPKDRPEATNASGDYKDNLRKFADDAKKAGAELIFVTPPRRLEFKDGKPDESLRPYAEAMKAVAAEKGLLCADLHESSGKVLATLGEEGAKPYYRTLPDGRIDKSHFSKLGAAKMAALILEDIRKSDSKIKAHLKK